MAAIRIVCNQLLQSLPEPPYEKSALDNLVEAAIRKTEGKNSAETRRSQWEYMVKNEVMKLAMAESKALKEKDDSYYSRMRGLLDLALTLSEHGAVDVQFPFVTLQDILETQTVASCSHIFSWLEERAPRMTADMVPGRGKALTMIRMLNDLLRRLSRTGSTAILSGRIQTFLAVIYPLGERSGVNLRGQYGDTWEGVKDPRTRGEESEKSHADNPKAEHDAGGESKAEDTRMQVDDDTKAREKEVEDKKADFYMTFWGLQLPFSDPKVFAQPGAFQQFKESVGKVLPALKEANAKEKAMMGSKGNSIGGQKRKRESDSGEESGVTEYFFAKLLTSPELLDLEIADVHFRRQLLFQLLILLNFISTFTKAAKDAWVNQRNRSLTFDFTLEPDDLKWVQDTSSKVADEFKSTVPNGKAFLESVNVVLEREKNWVRWKNELCPAFDRETWSDTVDGKRAGLVEATREKRAKMMEPSEEWKHQYGSKALTTIWALGYSDLFDLQFAPSQNSLEQYLKLIKTEDMKMEKRRQQLAPPHRRDPTPPVLKPETSDVVMESPPGEAAEPTIEAPKPVTPVSTAASNSLHPSLPPKPGSSPLPASTSTDSNANLNPQAATFVPKTSTPTPATATASAPPKPKPTPKPSTDRVIASLEERKQRYSWLALRSARDEHLHLFHKIGTGSVELLVQAITESNTRASVETETTAEVSAAVNGGSESSGTGIVGDSGAHEGPAAAGSVAPMEGVKDADSGGEATAEEPKPGEAMVES